MNYMAHLIGMEEAFVGEIGPSEERYLMNLLNEERYFIVLMAYDIPKLRRRRDPPILDNSIQYSGYWPGLWRCPQGHEPRRRQLLRQKHGGACEKTSYRQIPCRIR